MVSDVLTGLPETINREAGRILEGLLDPGQSPEELLDVLVVRRAGGREISLDEFPLALVLSAGETVRAEEVVLEVPDGRSVTVLVSATPIRSEQGGVESFIITIQDMTPLEEVQLLRAEFLGMVSHELRTPLMSIRGSASTLLDDASVLDPVEMRQFHRIIFDQADRMRGLISDLLDVARIETGTLPVSPGPSDVAVLIDESDGPELGSRFTFTIPAIEETVVVDEQEVSGLAARTRSPGNDRPRILVVDDDPQILRYVRDVLSKSGYTPIVAADPVDVIPLIEEKEPDLVLLDLMLPGTDGVTLMKAIHDVVSVPVIFLSAYGQDHVIAKAFQAGAADYVVKPFSPIELEARIQAALRQSSRSGRDQVAGSYLLGDLSVDYAQRRAALADREVELTATEYRMLSELSANAGRIMTHEQLLQRVWGYGSAGGSGPVRAIVKRLRRKLGDDASNPTYIFTKRRIGYWMERPESPSQ